MFSKSEFFVHMDNRSAIDKQVVFLFLFFDIFPHLVGPGLRGYTPKFGLDINTVRFCSFRLVLSV